MSQNQLHILVVEDDAEECEDLIEFLEYQENFTVSSAKDGEEALRLVEAGDLNFDVAIIDQLLQPGPDGVLVMEHIRKIDAEIECIILTGHGSEYRQKALEAGAFYYLEKPYDPLELIQLINRAAQQVRLRIISRQILTNHNLESLLDEICLAAISLTGAHQAAIVLPEVEPTLVWRPTTRRQPAWLRAVRTTLTAEIIKNGQARFHNLYEVEEKQGGALVGVPVPGKEGQQGVLYVYHRQAGYFHAGETIALLQTLAGQAGLALESASAFLQTRTHDQYMEALVKAGEELTCLENLDDQLAATWKFVRQQLNVTTFFIALFNDESRRITFPIYFDNGKEIHRNPRIVNPDKKLPSATEYVILSGRELAWSTEEDRLEVCARMNIRPKVHGRKCKTCLFIALRAGPEILGVMSIQAYEPHAFSASLLDAFRALGSQLIVAMSNARILQSLRRTTQNLNKLSQFALDIGKQRPRDELLKEILSQAVNMMKGAGGAIYLMEPDGKHLKMTYGQGDLQINNVIRHDRGLNGLILERGAPQWVADYRSWPLRLRELDHLNLTSVSGAPIHAGELTIGTLVVHDTEPGKHVDESMLALLQQLADHAGQAIQKSTLIERLGKIQKAATEISASLELEQVLSCACEKVIHIFQVDHCGIAIFDDDHLTGRVMAEYPLNFGFHGAKLNLLEPQFEHQLQTNAQALVIPDLAAADEELGVYKALWRDKSIRSIAIIPIVYRERVIGSYSLEAINRQRPFPAEEIELAKVFAAHLAVAAENAKLYAKSERNNRLLDSLDHASRTIRSESETPRLLHQVVRLAVELANGKAGCLLINRPFRQELEISTLYNLPDVLKNQRLSNRDSLVGQVVSEGKSIFEPAYSNWEGSESIFRSYPFRNSWAGPLIHSAGQVDAVLLIFDVNQGEPPSATDIEILDRFTSQAAAAYHTSQLINREHRILGQLEILYTISDYIQAAKDLDDILHMMLTCVTAGYGLEFNRGALFLFDETGELLLGKLGIGHLKFDDAWHAWDADRRLGRQNFKAYLNLLEEKSLPLTPIGMRIIDMHLPAKQQSCSLFMKVLQTDRCHLATQEELECLPVEFISAFEPALPLVLVPLKARGEPIGLLIADNKFTQAPITPEIEEILLTFTHYAAVAIANAGLYADANQERNMLRSFYEASNELFLSDDESKVMQEVVDKACHAANAEGVSLLIMDKAGLKRTSYTSGKDRLKVFNHTIRPHGISMHVFNSGTPEIIYDVLAQRDRVNVNMLERGVRSAVCLPLTIEGNPIGVIWFHYAQLRSFSKAIIQPMQLFANQAALIYDGVHRINELEHLRQAAGILASESESEKVLQKIVESARIVLEADSAAIWIYDDDIDQIIENGSVCSEIDDYTWLRLIRNATRTGHLTNHIFHKRWFGVIDIERTDLYDDFLSEGTRQILHEMNIISFQALALKVGDEKLGILFVYHRRQRNFTDEDREIASSYAYFAALALKKSRLLEEVHTAYETARQVSKTTLIGDIQQTLNDLVIGIKRSLKCDAVLIYRYDQERQRFCLPPAIIGVRNVEPILRYPRESEGSLPSKVLRNNEPMFLEKAAEHPLFRGRRFTQEEGVKSLAAQPLVVGKVGVGVMFVNYRKQHKFDPTDRSNIELFANQAAVAIRNDQLFQMEQQYAQALSVIQQVSAEVNASQDLDMILPLITQKAKEIFESDAASLMLWDEPHENLVIRSAFGLGERYQREQRISISVVESLISKNGLGTQMIPLRKSPLGDQALIEKENLHYALSAPLHTALGLIGVLNIYSRDEFHSFTQTEKDLATTLANDMAIAIQNAQHRSKLEKTQEQLAARTALAWMNMISGVWRHAIDNKAETIREQIQLLRKQNSAELAGMARVGERLERIERLATQIMEKPITSPLSAEEEALVFSINDLVKERIAQLWHSDPYQSILHEVQIDPGLVMRVRADPEWLRRALDILLDNAVDAVSDQQNGKITISTRLTNECAEISVRDNGPGIRHDIQESILKTPIAKQPGEKGLGLGLLMAQMIIQTYGGELSHSGASKEGACFSISLPIEKKL